MSGDPFSRALGLGGEQGGRREPSATDIDPDDPIVIRDERMRPPREARLKAAGEPEEQINRFLAGRVDVEDAMRHGVQPVEHHFQDVLLKGQRHHIYAPSGHGKTFLIVWILARLMEMGQRVLYFDSENGLRRLKDRLNIVGLNPGVAGRFLFYLPDAAPTMLRQDRLDYDTLLDVVKPSLVVFDAWISYLSYAGLSENENQEVERWAEAYLEPAWKRGITSVLLDHVPHEGDRHRGAMRKRDCVDVQWSLKKTLDFSDERVGEIKLRVDKDRDHELPQTVTFSIGGGEATEAGEFVLRRSDGTLEERDERGLTEKENLTLLALEKLLASTKASSATSSEWEKAAAEDGVPRRTFFRAKKVLEVKKFVLQEKKRYSPNSAMGAK